MAVVGCRHSQAEWELTGPWRSKLRRCRHQLAPAAGARPDPSRRLLPDANRGQEWSERTAGEAGDALGHADARDFARASLGSNALVQLGAAAVPAPGTQG